MSDADTTIARGNGFFPTTAWTEDAADATSSWPHRWDSLARRYWRPIYLHLRVKWGRSNEEAKDLSQEFFARLLERQTPQAYRPDQGRFRSFLRVVLDNFVREQDRAGNRFKRGGNARILSLDFDDAAIGSLSVPEETFDAAWRREVLTEALLRLERAAEKAGVPQVSQAVNRYYLTPSPEGRTYESAAREAGISVFDFTNLLHRARTWLREIVTEVVRETVVDPADLAQEIEELFGTGEGGRDGRL